MVDSPLPRLGHTVKLCLARPMLFAALERFDRGDLIGAGVRMREALTQLLEAAVHWYGVEVIGDRLPPHRLARALRDAKHMGPEFYKIALECIDVGNKAAHCQRVDAGTLRACISYMFAMMDSEPYCGR